MNHEDEYSEEMENENYRAATFAAIVFAEGCGSKARAWYWADKAIAAASASGVAIDAGNKSWPDYDAMRRQAKAVAR